MEQTLNTRDTIAAIATPHGRGAIAMIRLSGPSAIEIANSIWKGSDLRKTVSHTAHLGYICTPDEDEPIDQALATVFHAPATFTGEDLVEFGLHGSPIIAHRVLDLLKKSGARQAERGEFSRRAVANGRMSLTGAEAAADLVAASSRAALRIAMSQMRGGVERRLHQMQADLLQLASLLELELDFSEEDVEFASRDKLRSLALSVQAHLTALYNSYKTGQAIKDGIPVAIIGPTNAGKSSLLNALLDEERAIVSDIHGTTRDVVEDTLEIEDYLFRFMDTAGLRDTSDPIEKTGIERSHKALSRARIVMLVADASEEFPYETLKLARANMPQDATLVVLLNKIDQCEQNLPVKMPDIPETKICISAKSGKGIDTVKSFLTDIIKCDEEQIGDIVLTSERHKDCISRALQALERVLKALSSETSMQIPLSADLIAQEVRSVTYPLTELTGTALQPPAILQNIFSSFCIGK